MQLIRLLAIAVAGLSAVIGYVHERRRLDAIEKLSGRMARDYYEAGRVRNERMMLFVALAAVIAAVTFVVRAQGISVDDHRSVIRPP